MSGFLCNLLAYFVYLCAQMTESISGVTFRVTSPSNMTDSENTNMEPDKENMPLGSKFKPHTDVDTQVSSSQNAIECRKDACEKRITTEYCEKLQAWMWQYYTGYVNWQSWLAVSAMSPSYYLPQPANGTLTAPVDFASFDAQNWYNNPFGLPLSPYPPAIPTPGNQTRNANVGGTIPAAVPAQTQQQPQENGNAQRPGKKLRWPARKSLAWTSWLVMIIAGQLPICHRLYCACYLHNL